MIKINLVKPVKRRAGGGGAAVGPEGADVGLDAAEKKEIQKNALMRLALILLGPIGLILYENQVIPDLKGRLSLRRTYLEQIAAKNAKARDAVAQMQKFKNEQDVLQKQIDSIENLKKDRLREVKILDFIQKDTPEKVWLTKLDMNQSKLIISGVTVSNSNITLFMENLQKSIYLEDVNLIRSGDTTTEFGPLMQFEISCNVRGGT